jgi:hypothetical protein
MLCAGRFNGRCRQLVETPSWRKIGDTYEITKEPFPRINVQKLGGSFALDENNDTFIGTMGI